MRASDVADNKTLFSITQDNGHNIFCTYTNHESLVITWKHKRFRERGMKTMSVLSLIVLNHMFVESNKKFVPYVDEYFKRTLNGLV